MLRSISSRQLEEWKEFDRREPFGPQRDDARIASIVQVLLNVHRGRGVKAATLEDAILHFGDEVRKPKALAEPLPDQNWVRMKAIGQALTEASWEGVK